MSVYTSSNRRGGYVVAWRPQHRCHGCGRFLDYQPSAHGNGLAWCYPCALRLDDARQAAA